MEENAQEIENLIFHSLEPVVPAFEEHDRKITRRIVPRQTGRRFLPNSFDENRNGRRKRTYEIFSDGISRKGFQKTRIAS